MLAGGKFSHETFFLARAKRPIIGRIHHCVGIRDSRIVIRGRSVSLDDSQVSVLPDGLTGSAVDGFSTHELRITNYDLRLANDGFD